MSTSPNDNQAHPSDAPDWRANPPHLPDNGSDHFVSMASRLSPSTSPRPGSATSGERTTSPSAPTGLSATIETDANGRRYFRETATGLRIDLIDQAGGQIPSSPLAAPRQPQNDTDGTAPSATVSSESDLTPETRSDSATIVSNHGVPVGPTPESMIATLINGLDPRTLSSAQRGMLQTIQGALLTSRQRLLNTTAVVLDQRKVSSETHQSLAQFREETAERFAAFDDIMRSDHQDLDKCIQDNVALLTELGESEAAINRIIQSMGTHRIQDASRVPQLPVLGPLESTEIGSEMSRDINQALPPRQAQEGAESFHRRAELSGNSKRCAAAAFHLPNSQLYDARAPAPAKVTRFEDTSSISTAPRYRNPNPSGISTASDTGFGYSISGAGPISGAGKSTIEAMEEFNDEAEALIRSIIYRQVGEELTDVPARICPPRLDTPRKFTGVNNHQQFMEWVQELSTWMRASFMGGPGPTNRYRITVLKTHLAGVALQWFVDYVETRTGVSEIPYDFASIVCAMHRRFITAATAQKATREFDAVRYKKEDGPLKLMDELTDASARMREPLPDFVIRQRFMQLLPDSISGLMELHRALSAEYSDIATLRFNANQIWDVYNNPRNRSSRPSATGAAGDGVAPSSASAPRASSAPRRDAPRVSPPSQDHRPIKSVAPTGAATRGSNTVVGPNAHKLCYKCGFHGHISSDKICPKYVDNPRVAAQRIDDQYVDEDHAAYHEPHDHSHENPDDGLVDDAWGGSQYDPDDDPVRGGNEPGDLIDFNETAETRVGAMHFQHFSMRIEPTSDEPSDAPDDTPELVIDPLFANRPPLVRDVVLTRTQALLSKLPERYGREDERTIDDLYGPSSSVDVVMIQDARERNNEEPYSEDEIQELRRELLREHDYPITDYTSYEEAMFRFQLFEEPATPESMDEWAAIMTLGAAEHCRQEGLHVHSLPLGDHMSLSTWTLEYGTHRLVSDAAAYVPHIQAIRTAHAAAERTAEIARAALLEANVRTNPNSEGRTRDIRNVALDVYREVLEDMTALSTGHVNSLRETRPTHDLAYLGSLGYQPGQRVNGPAFPIRRRDAPLFFAIVFVWVHIKPKLKSRAR
ncbi:hypothetical protein DFH06DRAFT_1336150 [Mycena polygramma]|nr:hypothetical protein DFH06DRAFT_1336150 [Mycena polygramma]